MPLKIAKIVSEVNCVLWCNVLISDFYNFGELLPHGSYWQVECRIRGIGTFLPTQLQKICGRDCCSYLVAPEIVEKKQAVKPMHQSKKKQAVKPHEHR